MKLEHRKMLNAFFKDVSEDGEPLGVIPVAVARFGDEFEPYIKLVAAVMRQALEELDKDYIYNGGLQVACKLLDLDYRRVKWLFKDMYKIIKNDKQWRKW